MEKKRTEEHLRRQIRGHAGDAKGLRFEQHVANHFSKQGWEITLRKRMAGGEIDIYGERKKLLSLTEYLLVECKDKERVSAKDVTHFVKKVQTFYKHLPEVFLSGKPPVKAILAYTGEVDKDAKKVEYEPKIELKKF